MAQAQQQGQGGGDHSLAPVWIMALVLFSLYFVWKVWHVQIVAFIFYLNKVQAALVNVFLDEDKLRTYIYLMQTLDPRAVQFEQLVDFTNFIGSYIRYPVIAILVVLSLILYKSDRTLRYKKKHSMQSLKQQEQKNWSSIVPVVAVDLVAEDINTGPWAMALTPMEFARKHNLLKKNDVLLDNLIPGQEMTAGLRRGDAKRVFTLQLGPAFNGFMNTPDYVQALAAAFMARMNRDKKSAEEILSSLDKLYVSRNFKGTNYLSVLKKYENTEIVQEVCVKHAYLLTAMASLLQASRDDGVVPSSGFLWLKTVDRRLWYMLNCVGRQTPYAEVGGPFAHWRAEIVMGRSSRAPMIDEAIKALEIAIKEVKLTPKAMQRLEA